MISDVFQVNSVEELKSIGNLKYVRQKFFEKLENMQVPLKTNNWNNMYLSIQFVKGLYYGDKQNRSILIHQDNAYFKGEAEEYIFYLVELHGEEKLKKLKVNKMHYLDKNTAKKWKMNIAKKIHPDTCHHVNAELAMAELNKMYEEMIK